METASYAAYHLSEDTRLKSSSGGIFILLAEYVISVSGCVYGVSMTDDFTAAEFVRIDNKEELCGLMGSKYLQARIGDTFHHVKLDLENNIPVLFTGTPCQINGLKSFLHKEYDNLFCMDFSCHGVPSPGLWKKYIRHIHSIYKKKILSVNFRSKDIGWNDFGMKIEFENNKDFFQVKSLNPYMFMFLNNLSLRPSCYQCLAKKHRLSDITISDFWKIENLLPEMYDGKGTSLIIVRTEKGTELFNQIKKYTASEQVDYQSAVKNNPAEFMSVPVPQERDNFFSDFKEMDFKKLSGKYVRIPLKRRIKYQLLQMRSKK